jgi:hypothetical protein
MKFSFIVHCLLYNLLAVRYFTPVFLSISFSLFFSSYSLAQSYSLEVETYQVHSETSFYDIAGMTTYRLYLTQLCPTDFVSAIYGNDVSPFEISAPEGLFNHLFNPGWGAFSPAFVFIFPSLLFDSFATIGHESVFSSSGGNNSPADVSLLEDPAQPISPIFIEDGSTGAIANTLIGFAYYNLNGNPYGYPNDDGRVMIMQLTTSGPISGLINAQIFPNGVGLDAVLVHYAFDGPGIYPAEGDCDNDFDGDGVCDEDETLGCTYPSAENFSHCASEDDGTCIFLQTVVCGPGTQLDEETGACLVTLPGDSNFDNCVDLEDLLELLVLYGQCFPPQ